MPRQIGDLVFYELPEVAEKLDCHINTLRKYLRDGRLKGRKVGNKWLVSEDGLREFFCPSDETKDADDSFEMWPGEPVITTGENKKG